MTVFASAARREFYDQIWRRALADDCTQWCRSLEEPGTDRVVLVPHDDEHEDRSGAWPVLPDGDSEGMPGWAPDSDKIERAFAAILRSGRDRADLGGVGNERVRYRIRLAEDHVSAEELPRWICDLVLQVAIFGRVVFA
jgi:hypothetical protein